MECRYSLALIKGIRISVFSSYTGTKQTGTLKLTAHSQSTAFTWHTQKRDKLDVSKKSYYHAQDWYYRINLHSPQTHNFIFFFKETGTRRTNSCLAIYACQHNLIQDSWSQQVKAQIFSLFFQMTHTMVLPHLLFNNLI